MLQDVGAPIVLTNPDSLTAVPVNTSTIYVYHSAELWADEPTTSPCSSAAPSDTAYVLYTSGSGGTPRGVMLTHHGLVNYNCAVRRIYDLRPGDRMLQFFSISFD